MDLFLQTLQAADNRVRQKKREPMALEFYPPPADLTPAEAEHWRGALGDLPSLVFRARNLPTLREYVRLLTVLESSAMDEKRYLRLLRTILVMQRVLNLTVAQEVIRQRHLQKDQRMQKQAEQKVPVSERQAAGMYFNGGPQ